MYSQVESSTMSSEQGSYPAYKAFDGIKYEFMNFAHTGAVNKPHWIKAVFKEKLFIFWAELYNRKDSDAGIVARSNNIDLYTILRTNGQSVETWFGNTGILGVSKKFSCMKYADGIIVRQPIDQSADALNIGEIWMFGRVPKEYF